MNASRLTAFVITVLAAFLVSCADSPVASQGSVLVPNIPKESVARPHQRPYRTVCESRHGLEAWEIYYASHDEPQAAFFASHVATIKMLQDWMEQDKFHDNNVLARYIVSFAEEARKGLHVYHSGGTPPLAWKYFAAGSQSKKVSVPTSLLLGINAHVNRDLPFAIINAGIDPGSRISQEDNRRILDALAEVAPRIRGIIIARYQPRKRTLNYLLGGVIDHELGKMFKEARNRAWENAARLKGARTRSERQRIESEIERQAANAAELIIKSEGRYIRQLGLLRRGGQ